MPTKKPDHIWADPGPDGLLDSATIDEIDDVAGKLVEAVHCGGTADVDRIMRGMTWTHLAALALSVATLAEPASSPASYTLGFTAAHLRALHAAYQRGERGDVVRQGEVAYQRNMYQERKARQGRTMHVVAADEREA
ncbi:MAG: hypothetical protein WBF79_01940 [Rhodococcus sp. (in: high G+C Gram-positive bacteria)]